MFSSCQLYHLVGIFDATIIDSVSIKPLVVADLQSATAINKRGLQQYCAQASFSSPMVVTLQFQSASHRRRTVIYGIRKNWFECYGGEGLSPKGTREYRQGCSEAKPLNDGHPTNI